MKSFFLLPFFIFLQINFSSAQRIYPDKDYVLSFGKDIKSFKTAVFHPSEKAIIGAWAATGTTLLLMSFDYETKTRFQNFRTPTSNNISKYGVEPIGRFAGTLGAAAIYGSGYIFKNVPAQKASLLAFKSFLFSSAIVGVIKYSAQRERPYKTDNQFNFHSIFYTHNNVSFPSGHSSDAFAVATAVCSQIKNKYWHIPIYALASCVALSRIHDNKHWSSDVFVGSLIGFASAKIVINANNWKH